MSSVECRGCGVSGGDCADCLAITNWNIACGCGHSDHAACSKQCHKVGACHQPIGLVFSGTLEESELYRDRVPPRYLVARALAEARAEAERKYQRKVLKFARLELSLEDYPHE